MGITWPVPAQESQRNLLKSYPPTPPLEKVFTKFIKSFHVQVLLYTSLVLPPNSSASKTLQAGKDSLPVITGIKNLIKMLNNLCFIKGI